MPPIDDHPLRYPLTNELHARPFPSLEVPCTTIWFREFGFATLPFMAMCGFAAIMALSVVTMRGTASPAETT